jgi:amidase
VNVLNKRVEAHNLTIDYHQPHAMPAQWEAIALRKRQERDSKIPKEWRLPTAGTRPTDVTGVPRTCGILSEKEIDITENYDARDIVDAIVEARRWTAEEVAIAFCKV